MKKRSSISIIILIFALLISTACTKSEPISNRYDGEEAMKHVVELASPEYTGRLPGTKGNTLAAEYIAQAFAQYGLEASGDKDTYYQWYDQQSIVYGQPFTLEVLRPDGSLEKSFRYRYDFLEANANEGFSLDLTVGATECTVSTSDSTIVVADPNGGTVMIGGHVPRSGNGDSRAAMFNRSAILRPQTYPTIVVTPEVFEGITAYLGEGYFLRLLGEVDYPQVSVPNVVAHMPAIGKSQGSLMITAHFDHLGVDCTGEINSGAVDNAGGIAVMLELARVLSQEQLPMDLMFIAFNGEEGGLLGAKYYAKAVKTPTTTKMINIDTVGLSEFDYTVLLYAGAGKTLASDLAALYRQHEQVAHPAPGNTRSDHTPFGQQGYEAVSIVQLSQHYFDNQYHTPCDTIDLLSASSLQQVGDIIMDYITKDMNGGN